MKSFLLLLLFPLIAIAGLEDLKRISSQVNIDLAKGLGCIPSFNTSGYQMCGGTSISAAELQNLFKLDLSTCQSRITQYGHKIYDPKSNILSKEYNEFQNSTMRALVLHDKNTVFFKEGARSVDCIHELLHIYQRTTCSNNDLCPNDRKKRANLFLKIINTQIDKITALERKGDKPNAQKAADALRPYIAVYGKLADAINWLDEKDVHFFIYHRCNELQCQSEDKEIALANLFRLKQYFPSRFNNYVVREAASIIRQKESEVLPTVLRDWNKLNNLGLKIFRNTPQSDIKALSEFLRKQKISLKRIVLKAKSTPFGIVSFPDDQISPLKRIDLKQEFYARNLDLKEFDGATMVCDKSKKVIVLAKGATYEQVLRELYNALLSDKNPEICTIASVKRKITERFNRGNLKRDLYESQVLRFKAMRRIASSEFFGHIIGHPSLTKESLLSIYPHYFLNQIPVKAPFPIRKGSIVFRQHDELPRVMVNGQELVLDFGAMNSILPVNLFNQSQLDSAEMIKTVTLRTAYGTSGKSPVLLFGDEIKMGGRNWENTRFALFDLKLGGITGLLGIDFFKGNDFILSPKKNVITFSDSLVRPDSALTLVSDFGGGYSALEFLCSETIRVRLDTGSQYHGEMSHTIGKENYNLLQKGKGIPCGKSLKLRGNFKLTGKNPILFDRGVSLNLGWPWVKSFSQVQVSLKSGWINFIK